MSNSNGSANSEAEPVIAKVDERLSKLSVIARNVTLRLTRQMRAAKRSNVSGKTTSEPGAKEPHDNKMMSVGGKIPNKTGNVDLCSTGFDLTSILKEKEVVGSQSDCSGGSVEIAKHKQSSSIATRNSSTCLVAELAKVNKLSENLQQPKTEAVKLNQLENPKQAEEDIHNYTSFSNARTNKIEKTCLLMKESCTQNLSPKKSGEREKCKSPKQAMSSRNKETSIVKPRTPLGPIQRRKSMRLRDRSLVGKKSFLKKGDGLAARKQLTVRKKAASSGGEENKNRRNDNNQQTTLRMPGRNENSNTTFLLSRNNRRLNKSPLCDDSKTAKSSSRCRRQWSENSLQTYEGMIFSSVLAFSEELRESSDLIHSKLKELYDSTSKTKTNSIFTKKSSGLTKEWRKNNRELLDGGSQEIAEIFSNLRKVESNLKTVDQAVSILLKEKCRNKERINCFMKPKDCQIVQKGIK